MKKKHGSTGNAFLIIKAVECEGKLALSEKRTAIHLLCARCSICIVNN